ncbi:hypothetical protein HDU76_013930 [Blyttiomyces sp. JEL0837]|nr:hypothetical protein HDU76_013930 [Blyttiomyces sp. JEL0837]
MPLVEASLSLLDCRNIEGTYVLFPAPSQRCYQGSHIPAAAFAYLMLAALLIAFPTFIGCILYSLWKRGQLDYDEKDKEEVSVKEQMLQSLYLNFKPDYFFIEPLLTLEKGVIVFILFMTGGSDNTNLPFILLFAMICALRIYIQPYQSVLEAYLNREICLGWLILLALKITADTPNTFRISSWVTLFIILPIAFHATRVSILMLQNGAESDHKGERERVATTQGDESDPDIEKEVSKEEKAGKLVKRTKSILATKASHSIENVFVSARLGSSSDDGSGDERLPSPVSRQKSMRMS